MQTPLVTDAAQQRFERCSRGKKIIHFHVDIGDMRLALYTFVAFIIFGRISHIAGVIHTEETVSILMTSKDDR